MYAKAIVAAFAAATVAAQTAVSHGGTLTAQDWANIALAAAGVLAVYIVPNQAPPAPPAPVTVSTTVARTDKQLLLGGTP